MKTRSLGVTAPRVGGLAAADAHVVRPRSVIAASGLRFMTGGMKRMRAVGLFALCGRAGWQTESGRHCDPPSCWSSDEHALRDTARSRVSLSYAITVGSVNDAGRERHDAQVCSD